MTERQRPAEPVVTERQRPAEPVVTERQHPAEPALAEPQMLVGRAVGKVIQRGEHIFLMFSVPGRTGIPEIRLHLPLDGEVVLEPEPAEVGEIDLQKLFYLYDLASLTVAGAGVEANGDLRIDFTDGTELTAIAGPDGSGWTLRTQPA